jgi:hypothetical protein
MMILVVLPLLLVLLLVLVLGNFSSTSTGTSRSTRLSAIGLSLCPLAAPVGAWAQAGLQVEAGLDGKIHPGRWAPVRVIATNGGQPVVGRLELMLPGARTALPLELPTAAKKQIETVLIPQLTYTTYGVSPDQAAASLREGALHGSGGREIAGAQVPIKLLPDSSRLLVVCAQGGAGESGSLRFLDGLPLGETGWSMPLGQQAQFQNASTVTAHVPPAGMPSDWAGLDAADLLVIRDAAWQQLAPRQRRAVRQWTEMGGRLLLCGEDPTGFADPDGRLLLPIEPTGARPRAQLTALPLPGREPIRGPIGSRVMTVGARARPDALVVLKEAGSPVVVLRSAGFGGVLWVGFDPFRVPPGTQAGRQALWSFLIAHATGAETTEAAFQDLADVPAASEPAKRLPHFPTPSRWTLGAFGLVYVLVFGPLNIWLLRRLRRTVRAWLFMPAVAVIMAAAVLGVGTAWGQARVVFHEITLLETMAGSGTAREQCLAVLFSPTNRAFAMEIDDPAPRVRFLPEGGTAEDSTPAGGQAYPGYRPADGPLPQMPDVRDGDLSRWDRIPLTLWTRQPIQADLATDLGGSVRVELDERLAGRVVNDTPLLLRDAYLQFHGWRQPLGELTPGGTRTVTPSGWHRSRRLSTYSGSGSSGQDMPAGGGMEASGGDLFAEAGSLLRTSAARPEVVLVARAPAVAPPIQIPGVTRSPVEGMGEGALFLVRKRVSPAAGPPPAGGAQGTGR